ncbi:hypothetical protein D3C75_1225120 [compost metagenome]
MTIAVTAAELDDLAVHIHIRMAHVGAVAPLIEGTYHSPAVSHRTLHFMKSQIRDLHWRPLAAGAAVG